MAKIRIVHLSEIGEIITGNTPKTSDLENYESNDIPFLKPSDFITDSIDLYDTEFFISEKARNKARILPVGSVAVTCIGIIGKTKITQKECAFNQQINAIIPFMDNYNRYIAYAINFQKELLQRQANAAVVPIINKTEFSKIAIPLPPLETQKQIAANLDKVTQTIELCNNILEKLDLLVKARFVEMFGDPVSNSMDWKTEQMNTVAPAVNYSGRFEDEVWLLNLDMVETQTGKIIDYLYVSENEVGNSTCTFDTSNVLYSKLRPYLNKVVIPDRCGYATSELVPLQPVTTKLNREYFAYMLRSDFFVNMINEKVAGAKMPRVSMGDFRKFEVPIPLLELQEQFAAFVEQTDKSKSAVKQVLEKAETLKKALMQEYFG